jgi:lysyl-tRNA synthetase class 2
MEPLWRKDLRARRPLFEARAVFLREIRAHFRRRRFLEVDPPLLVPAAGMEPHLDPFEVRGTATSRRAYLPTSPEFYLKKLVASGVDRCFALAPSFRDEAPGRGHSPEFLMLEWYRPGRLGHLLRDTRSLLRRLAPLFLPEGKLRRGGVEVDLLAPIRVFSLPRLFAERTGRDFRLLSDGEAWRELAARHGAAVTGGWSPNDCFSYLVLACVEPYLATLPVPAALVGYPAFQAALARSDPRDRRIVRRMEVFAGGVELANGYEELRDGEELGKRFAAFQEERRRAGLPPHPPDGEFFEATALLPPCAGIALGADRLLALLLGETVGRVRHGTGPEGP